MALDGRSIMFRMLRCVLVLTLLSVHCFGQSNTTPPAPTPATPTGDAQTLPAAAPPGTGAAAAATVAPPPNLLGEALALYRKGNLEGAIAKYQAILQEKPKSPDAFAGLIRVYLKENKVGEAAQTADHALALSDAPRIRVARAEVLFRQGKIEMAEKEWVSIINSGFPEARAYLGVARVRQAFAMYKSAEKLIRKAHDLDPNDPDIQQSWLSILPRAERIKYLEDSLAADNNWSPEERASTHSYLDYLKERAKKRGSPCRLVSKVTATQTPLVRLMIDPTHLRGYGLPVALNGHKNSLLLDTGATGILVKRSIAEKAGITKITASKVGGVGDKGWKNSFIGVADSIKVGDLEFQNCPIEVMESRSVADEDGLIGADVFEDFLVDIDFPDEKLKLSELPKRPGEEEAPKTAHSEDDDSDEAEASESVDSSKSGDDQASKSATRSGPQDRYIAPEMQSYSRVFRFGHDLLIPTKIGDAPYKLFLLDTGALINSISPAAAREVTKVGFDPDTTVKGLSGSVNRVYSANKAVLQFGGLRQENQDIVGFDTTAFSNDAGTEISGFLGFAMLRILDIQIDYRDALVKFTYDPKRGRF